KLTQPLRSKGPGIARWHQQNGLFVCYVGKVTSPDRSEASLFGNGATKVTFIAALRSRLISAITAMRTIPWTQESTRYLMMRFSANMTNDESVRVPTDEDGRIWRSSRLVPRNRTRAGQARNPAAHQRRKKGAVELAFWRIRGCGARLRRRGDQMKRPEFISLVRMSASWGGRASANCRAKCCGSI